MLLKPKTKPRKLTMKFFAFTCEINDVKRYFRERLRVHTRTEALIKIKDEEVFIRKCFSQIRQFPGRCFLLWEFRRGATCDAF